MIRRRRRTAEIPFSLDSFLDVVANVVGIIIKLILVAWVGARSYSAVMSSAATEETVAVAATPEPAISLSQELTNRKQQLEQAQARLLDQLRQVKEEDQKTALTKDQLDALIGRRLVLDKEKAQVDSAKAQQGQALQQLTPSLDELRKRSLKVREELLALEKQPPLKKTLMYRTPVSRPVQAEELHFELQNGKAAFIDVSGFLAEIKRGLEDKGQLLRSRWEVEETTSAVGPFRLRYVFERERGPLDGAAPGESGNFSYGLTRWQVEPTAPLRGESATNALAPGSAFRQIVDGADAHLTVVTLWVYPDSFPLYRQLRDYLQEHNLEVAGRPLPFGMPIASSRHGSASRGQ